MSEYVKIELTEEALQRIIDHCKVAENKVDDVQEVLDSKMDKSNPSGTGSFSMNRAQKSLVGLNSHAEGTNNTASGAYSHAEGGQTKATGTGSHAEGDFTVAIGKDSHAEGWDTKAVGENSHAEGTQTYALGKASHVGGIHTEANYDYQTVVGRFNDNKSNTLFEVGNGADAENLNNALEVRQNGDVYIDGDFYNGDGEKVEPFGKAFFVSFTGTSNGNNYSYSCDKTYSQIREQFDAKNLIVAHFYDELDSIEMTTSLVGVDAGDDELNFRFFVSEDGLGTIYWDISIDSTDTITSSGFKRSKEIPYVDSSDVGKVLSVNSNGNYYVKALDNTPTQSSDNPISSGAVWNKLQGSKAASSSSGSITISDYGMTENMQMYFKPNQDLHGYSKPWAGGAGKNKLVYPYATSSTTESGVTFTVNTDGTIEADGTATSDITLSLGKTYISDDDFTFSGVSTGSSSTYYLRFVARDSGGQAITIDGQVFIDVYTIETTKTLPSNVSYVDAYLGIKNGTSLNDIIFEPMIRLATETDSTFEPYANICPIVGQDNATFSWGSNNELVMNFGNTYYGGSCNFNGQLFSEWDYIASYNGETLSGEWMSDRDKYVSGTTPTTGAEVVYKTTATHVKVTPPANLNLTHAYPIEYNGYMATIIYQPRGTVLEEAKKYTNRKIGQLVPQVYSTSEEKVGAWIDGKTIYQKTIDCGALPNTTTKYISTDIEASQIVKIEGIATAPQSGGTDKAITIPMPFTGSGGSYVGLYAHILSTNKISIRVSTDADRSAYNGYITIQYTKLSN